MSSSIIKPSVGRHVWFNQGAPGMFPGSESTCAAIIAHVWDDHLVNLCVIDRNGNTLSRTSVPLVQPGEQPPASGFFCTWMDWQVAAAQQYPVKVPFAGGDQPKQPPATGAKQHDMAGDGVKVPAGK